jgi:hypothetical protein
MLLLGLAGLLGSCQPPVPGIVARNEGGKTVFHLVESGGWFSADEKAYRIIERFTVFSRDGAVWVIDRDPKCVPPGDSSFPLTYGQVTTCFTERFPAKPLKQGTIYRVEASDAWDGSGAFRMNPTIELLDAKERNEAEAWPAANHPRQTHPAAPLPAIDPENTALPEPSDVPVGNDGPPAG